MLKAKIKGVIVVMVTYCVTKLTATCFPMIGQCTRIEDIEEEQKGSRSVN